MDTQNYELCFQWVLSKLENKQSNSFYFLSNVLSKPNIVNSLILLTNVSLIPLKILALPHYFYARRDYLRDRCVAKIIAYCIIDYNNLNNDLFQPSATLLKYHKNICGKKNIKCYSFETLKINFESIISNHEKKYYIKYDRDILKKNILILAKKYQNENEVFTAIIFMRQVLNNTPYKFTLIVLE